MQTELFVTVWGLFVTFWRQFDDGSSVTSYVLFVAPAPGLELTHFEQGGGGGGNQPDNINWDLTEAKA